MFSVLYLLVCIAVGLAGRRRRIGFTGLILVGLFLTPVPPLLYLLITQKRFLEQEAMQRAYNVYCRRCGELATSVAYRSTCGHCGAPL